MDITFAKYDTANRVPGVWAEFDASNANNATERLRSLIIGQGQTGKVTAALASVPQIVSSQADVAATYGARSQLALMVAEYRQIDPTGELWILPLADPTGGAAASGTVAFAGTATAAGTIGLYVGGVRVEVPVSVGDTAAVIATNAAADVNAVVAPVVASAASGTLTLAATGPGVWGNDSPIVLNYGGTLAGEAMPAGITATVTQPTGGVGTPPLATGLANLGSMPVEFVCCPFTDTTSLNALRDFFDDNAGRWSWSNQLFGGYFTAFRGTLGERTAWGLARNDQYGTGLGFKASPSPAWLWAAAYAAGCAASARVDPALPLQDIALPGLYAPLPVDRDLIAAANTLLYDGVSTCKVGDDGLVRIQRSVTFYQKNAAGVADDAYLDTETLYTLAKLARDMRSFLSSTYARKKLVADGTEIEGGSNQVTAQHVLGSAISRYRRYCDQGFAQDYATFKQSARAQNLGSGLVGLFLPFNVANQLRSIALKVSFLKS